MTDISTVRWLRRYATIAIATSAIGACIALTAAPSMAASAASPAAAAGGVHSGIYRTWKAAQHAAGFGLLRPASTGGLRPAGGIRVVACTAHAANVSAQYGHASGKMFGLLQDNAPHAQPCSDMGVVSPLGHYRVDGTTATLLGACGTALPGEPSCHDYHVWLFLTWTRHGRYYQVISHDESRSEIVRFGRGLHRVG